MTTTPHYAHDHNNFHVYPHKGTSCRFYNANGELNRYALACGYIERRELAPDFTVDLYMEHAHYNVRIHTQHDMSDAVIWEVFDTLGPARQLYHKLIKEYGANHQKESAA